MGIFRKRSPEEKAALQAPPMSRALQAFSMGVFFLLGAGLTVFLVRGDLPALFSAREAAPVRAEDRAETLYQCAMHPQVLERHPGDCPICGMALTEKPQEPGKAGEREVLYWYAPMDPTYIRDEPGVSPMGMELVPKYADVESDAAGDAASGEVGIVAIDPVQVQNIGVVSVPATVEDIARSSKTVGILDFNAERITWINVKFEGWIEKVHVNYVGQETHRGQPLFEVYSPELVTTQEEYLRALDYRRSLESSPRVETRRQAENLVSSTRERLRYWDISEEQIREIEETEQVQRRITITAPGDGTVVEIMQDALEGMFVRPGMNLYKIADLSNVWVHADVYEADLPWVRRGGPAVVSFRNAPGRTYEGAILFLYPEVSPETRTLKICVEIPNLDRRLRPGMYADVVVHGPPIPDAVIIPQSAVLRSGERDLVFIDLGEGRFEPREVRIGVQGDGDRVEVLQGVAIGEAVVTQAQFMLDSESRIQEAIAKFRQRGTVGPAAKSGPDEPPR